MSLGAGILWSTIIALIAIAIWRTTVNKKWKTVGKVFGVIVTLGVLTGVSIWGWFKYKDRAQIVTELAGVKLGMTKVEVTLALGNPSYRVRAVDERNEFASAFIYQKEYDENYSLFVGFDRQEEPRAIQICEDQGDTRLLGLGRYSSEQQVVAKLDQPAVTSISHDGLRKLMSYPQWKTVFQIEKGAVTRVCVAQDGVIEYPKEKPVDRWQDDPIVEDP